MELDHGRQDVVDLGDGRRCTSDRSRWERPMRGQPVRRSRLIGSTLVLGLALAACGGGEEEPTTGEAGTAGGGEECTWEPERNVTLTVPFGAGGGTDTMARAIAEGLKEVRPEVEIQVVNRTGAGGAVGYSHVFQQQGNPHELLAVESSILTAPYLTETPWTYNDFVPVGQVSAHTAGVTAPAGEYADLSALLDAFESSETLRVGLAGSADSFFDIIYSALAEEIGDPQNVNRVYYENGNLTALSVVSGDSEVAVMSPEHVTEFLRSGDLDLLAVFTEERIEQGPLKDVPTAAEQGVDFSLTGVRGLSAAPGTEEQACFWQEAFLEWTEQESYDEYITTSQSLAVPVGPEEYMANLAEFDEAAKRFIGGGSS